jgi:ketosteroid isomerase-like protein
MVGSHAEIELSSAIQRQVEGVGAIHRGKAGMVQFWNEWHTAWRDSKIEITETRDLGDTVLALFRFRAQGIVSGAPVDMAGGWLFQFEDGLIRRAWAYSTPEQALEAAGLSE